MSWLNSGMLKSTGTSVVGRLDVPLLPLVEQFLMSRLRTSILGAGL